MKFKPLFYRLSIIWTIIYLVMASEEEERLVVDLFQDYNKYVRPVEINNMTLEVQVSMSLNQLVNINEKNQEMTTNVWLNLKWKDYQFKWEELDYGGLNVLRLPSDKIWKPDIALLNSANGNYDLKYKSNVIIYSDGMVQWIPPAIYQSLCSIDVTYFPFDQQTCSMKFSSLTFDADQVSLKLRKDEHVDLSNYWKSGNWDIIEAPASLNKYNSNKLDQTSQTDITFHITIRRKALFYTVNLILPIMLISFLCILVFYLPAEAGEKITLAISILISLVVFLVLISKILPPSSLVLPLIAKYLLFIFIMNCVSILVTVVIINLNFISPTTYKMPTWIYILFLRYLPIVLCLKRPKRTRFNWMIDMPALAPSNSSSNSEANSKESTHTKSTSTTKTKNFVTSSNENNLIKNKTSSMKINSQKGKQSSFKQKNLKQVDSIELTDVSTAFFTNYDSRQQAQLDQSNLLNNSLTLPKSNSSIAILPTLQQLNVNTLPLLPSSLSTNRSAQHQSNSIYSNYQLFSESSHHHLHHHLNQNEIHHVFSNQSYSSHDHQHHHLPNCTLSTIKSDEQPDEQKFSRLNHFTSESHVFPYLEHQNLTLSNDNQIITSSISNLPIKLVIHPSLILPNQSMQQTNLNNQLQNVHTLNSGQLEFSKNTILNEDDKLFHSRKTQSNSNLNTQSYVKSYNYSMPNKFDSSNGNDQQIKLESDEMNNFEQQQLNEKSDNNHQFNCEQDNLKQQKQKQDNTKLHQRQRASSSSSTDTFYLSPSAFKATEAIEFIAEHLRNEDEYIQIREDWKFVALVIDRLQLYIFFIVTILGTLTILFDAPYMFELVNQDEVIKAHSSLFE